ncbi:type II toxin-antitoxin system Phd/YefM family antitoxin [Mesorhizobium sp. VK9D]|uniref:type II toxin-antitoxin system Phd/YefM family antitoxin n=1 Tax=Mesorhizobium australafricanum TaxID=3072311 RepID=UPI002A2400C8|nr:type II toxin-antitoxin system Phd/YefM family antitoxin [Mesorhizobium sp. VK9D]MDX8453470.1 type II toxin-antitoxin system Phd/YefM family antitoxin [Mesorhizobium sp. VK9D]
MNWHLQDAKNNLSKLVQEAREKGPQTITLRGKPAAVVLAAEEYERLVGSKPSLVEYLLSGPEWDDEFAEEVNRRSKGPGRDVDL